MVKVTGMLQKRASFEEAVLGAYGLGTLANTVAGIYQGNRYANRSGDSRLLHGFIDPALRIGAYGSAASLLGAVGSGANPYAIVLGSLLGQTAANYHLYKINQNLDKKDNLSREMHNRPLKYLTPTERAQVEDAHEKALRTVAG